MRRPLPPLNAVRAFEAAGRHESFARAAQELHVTPGAISRHVKTLEDLLGVRLFTRANRQVRLTPEAIVYHKAVVAAFDRLGDATSALAADRRERPLRVMCSEVVAMRWLFPRLPRIHASHPQMPLSFRTTLTSAELEFDRHASDLVIRVGHGPWPPELASHRMFDSQLVAICSARLIERGPPLATVGDLRAHALLGSGLRPQAWPRWLAAAGAPDLKPKRYIELENSALAYQAAEEGLGVALGERGFLGEDLRAGHLVIPLAFVLAGDEAFHLVYERQHERTPHLAAFRDWVLKEARLVRAALAEPVRVSGGAKRAATRSRRAAH
ncbi:MAG: LysR family transcriptional regulator [Betaproteobacteria bacterium PRO3]|nr:LysR family transcriptional regulator [Betaproteobacteria bacterium PRO3]